MGHDDKYAPPTADGMDHVHAALQAVTSIVPLIGSPAESLFSYLITPQLERRRAEWMESVAEGLRAIEIKQASLLDDLRENPVFVDTVLQASQAAVHTSQQEKLTALRNAVFNAALPNAPEASKQAMFIGWVQALTPMHIRVLRLLANPVQWFHDQKKSPPQYHISGSIIRLIGDTHPELAGQREFVEKLYNDLVQQGLLSRSDLHAMMSTAGVVEERATQLGRELLAFITSPPEAMPPDGESV